jgi:pyoverdine/dityrosine biosynthesis protein Dit1
MSGGLHVVVLSDGTLYADTLLLETTAATQYAANIRDLRDSLNISGTVSILDLRELVEDAARIENYDFWDLVENVEKVLHSCRTDPDWSGHSSFRSLVSGVRWNMSWKGLGNISSDAVWEQLICPPEAHIGEKQYGATSHEIVTRSIRYAAINVVLRVLAPINKLLPDAMRATVHPKPGQIALPRFGSVSPWNGVAMIDSPNGLPSVENVQIHPTFRLALRDRRYIPLVDTRRSTDPVGYIVAK